MAIITLTTDFGDLYPAAMKAVILGLNPEAKLVDITSTPRAGIREGAFALYSVAPFFPGKTVHVAVIDPGVGTGRRPLAIKAGDPGQEQFFIGPDNGLLIPAASRIGDMEVHEITNMDLCLPTSHTFHGRDIFAPIGAFLSKGLSIGKVGPKISDFVDLDFGKFGVDGGSLFGEVLLIDSFGNLITNIPETAVMEYCSFGSHVEVNGRKVPFVQTYGLAGQGESLALLGSHGFLEIAVNQGSAALRFSLKNGDPVRIKVL